MGVGGGEGGYIDTRGTCNTLPVLWVDRTSAEGGGHEVGESGLRQPCSVHESGELVVGRGGGGDTLTPGIGCMQLSTHVVVGGQGLS